MNLHKIATGVVSAVNPYILVTLQLNSGYSVNQDGTRTPTYIYQQKIPAQIQALTFDELRLLDGLNIQGIKRAIYLSGQLSGINRSRNLGGDLIAFPQGDIWPYGTLWLVILVVEQWPNWVKVAVTQQIASSNPIPRRGHAALERTPNVARHGELVKIRRRQAFRGSRPE